MPLLARLRAGLARLDEISRPVSRDLQRVLAARWAELPERVRHERQSIGRRTAGCEGTHGVFPRCNLACTPCYHSRDANRVRVDGPHTLAEIDRQMAHMRRERGPGQNVQLIGGEVSLLGAETHAQALETMHRHGRKPMSMTHGDFDEDYLRRLALCPDGSPRFRHLVFAAHFDHLMFGRRGIEKPPDEQSLNPYRARFCAMFERLRREHGVSYYLAHNMTVTPANLDQLPETIRACRAMGFRMLSFQPAAFIGNPARWRDGYRELSADDVWSRLEAGAGVRLPWRVIQHGDERCNRSAYGAEVGGRWVPFLDDRDPRDMRARDAFLGQVGAMDFQDRPGLVALRLARLIARHPGLVAKAAGVGRRFVARAGGPARLRGGVRPMTFVMHRFMEQAVVGPAWELMERGQTSDDPRVREAQERLAACSYHMAHPDDGRLVPACVQHSVLDPEENRRLRELLPLPARA